MLKKSVILIIMLVALSSMLMGAGETIYEIRVEGNQNVDAELVKSAISLRLGDALDPEEVSKSIKNLYKLTIFSDVQFVSEPYRTGINLIIMVEEYPIVQEADFIGFKSIKKDRLDELVGLRLGSYWSPHTKIQAQRKLKAEYESKGFKNAIITIEEKPQPNNRVSIRITSEEGRRVAIQQITFIGNHNFDDRTLGRRMKTKSSSLLRSGRFEQEKFDTDLKNILAYYRKNGFIDVRITNWDLQQLGDRHLELIITIDEGMRFTFGSIEISGNDYFTQESLGAAFTLKSGEPFDQEKFDQQLSKVYSMYFDEGFIYTTIEPEKIRD
ncbi:MAG: POTRA domain-containing protein, partial [Candidatus Cloacimonadaceae bacterium]|nr:POTRA domain-containing protein [Candidatus Cloacimonadaceae bacterium]